MEGASGKYVSASFAYGHLIPSQAILVDQLGHDIDHTHIPVATSSRTSSAYLFHLAIHGEGATPPEAHSQFFP